MPLRSDKFMQSIPTSHTVQQVTSYIAAGVTPILWTTWLPTVLASMASTFTIIWLGLQIAGSVQEYVDKRHLARGPRGHQGDKGDPGKDAVISIKVDKPSNKVESSTVTVANEPEKDKV